MYKPEENEYAPYYKTYIAPLLEEEDIVRFLDEQEARITHFFSAIAPEKEGHRYAEGKWSIKEVLGHLTDTERVFAYRAMRFARNDNTPLPGFGENDYVANAAFADRSMYSMVQEFSHLRKSNVHLFGSLSGEALQRTGLANNNPVSVRALMYIIAGHARHHMAVVKERYLAGA